MKAPHICAKIEECVMNILAISEMGDLKREVARFEAQNRRLIGVGIVLPFRKEWQVALIDVTEEVEKGFLRTDDLQLVNSFIHSYDNEIKSKIEEAAKPLALAAH